MQIRHKQLVTEEQTHVLSKYSAFQAVVYRRVLGTENNMLSSMSGSGRAYKYSCSFSSASRMMVMSSMLLSLIWSGTWSVELLLSRRPMRLVCCVCMLSCSCLLVACTFCSSSALQHHSSQLNIWHLAAHCKCVMRNDRCADASYSITLHVRA